MAKISILTFSKGDSYGAVLQSYALATILREWGHQVEFIHLYWLNSWRQFLLKKLTPISYRFEEFRKLYLSPFSKPCSSFEDLAEVTKNTDICIVGSDQVWNPDITKQYMLHYFFDFLPENTYRIAYAASFGIHQWRTTGYETEIIELLKKFSYISVREDSAIHICEDVFRVEAVKVLDPTFLIENYMERLHLIKCTSSNIISFKFSTNSEYYKLLSHMGNKLQKRVVSLDPIRLNTSSEILNFKLAPFSSVESWLHYILNAELVITDSFHCTVFSILFKKQFIVIPGDYKRVDRIHSLLKELNLLDRYYPKIEDLYKADSWCNSIDYSSVFEIIAKQREHSLDFLRRAIYGG